MIVLTPDILPFFAKAGWHEGRKVALSDSYSKEVPNSHPANEILAQFGGLTVGEAASGQECATDVIAFVLPSEEFNPDWESSPIKTWNTLLKTKLVCIASVHHDHGELYVDTTGRCFGLSLIHDAFCFEGESFVKAMHRAMFGIRSRPMLRPDQESVMLYGIHYNAESPELYKY